MAADKSNPSQRSAIDWALLRERLEESAARFAAGTVLSPERSREILKERARKAAVVSGEGMERVAMLEIVEFQVVHEHFAVETSFVREVVSMRQYAVIPWAPSFVLGAVNLRGRIVSVVDLKKLFGLPDRGLTNMNKIIVLQHHRMEFGLLADAVLGVRSVPAGDFVAPPPTFTGLRAALSKGVSGEFLALLDAGKLLSSPQLSIADERSKEKT